ncbi:MAG: LuxR C-terminal-related transcriptional regulator [Bacillota bacterium]|nr:LuxR C-terminal-related transcriptional regulator [Bacillota bacterium]
MKDDLSFISTKLRMPIPRKNYVRREGLFSKLENMMDYKVTLIQGTAGSGKTTLLTSFIKENPLTTYQWITINPDNNLFSFWYYMLEATKVHLGKEKENIFSLFKSIMQKEDIEKLMVILINQLSLADEFAIVLDDFHLVRDEYLLTTIEFFIKNCSSNVHLVLLTRERPALYLGDLIMAGQLLEIGEEEMKFSSAEGRIFLNETLNIDIDSEMTAKISNLAEGWVGGLQLIALAVVNNRDSVINNIKVLNKYVVEYLSREILDSLSQEEKDFLVHTSVLSYFNEAICNQVLEKHNTKEIINRLLDKNLFIIEIDNGEAYRYHNIFDEFLKVKFSQLNCNKKKQIQLKAAQAYEKIGDFDGSIKHYLEIEQFQEALKVIEKIGQNPKGWSYLSQIPLKWVVENKELLLQRFFYHYCNLELEQCRHTLEVLDSKADDQLSKSISTFAKALIEEQNLEVDLNFLEELKNIDLGEVTKAIMLLNTSAFLAIQDKYNKALELAEQVMTIESNIQNPYLKFFALSLMSQIKEELGDLTECRALYGQIFQLIEENPLLDPLAANSYIGITGIYLKSLNLNMAEQSLTKASQIIKSNYSSLERAYLFNLLELKCLTGEVQEAGELLNKLNISRIQENHLYYFAILKYLIFLQTDKELLNNFVELFTDYRKNHILRMDDKLLYARVLFMQEKVVEALELVDQVLEFTRRNRVKVTLIQGLLLKVDILDHIGGKGSREILNLLREAVHYSYSNNIISPYVFQKELVKKYILQLREERNKNLNLKEKSFLNQLVGAFHQDETESLLTEREVEVLSVLASGATNKEIAETLCIGVATVKTHIINIYSKLQVANRVEAVEKAKKEGIVNY